MIDASTAAWRRGLARPHDGGGPRPIAGPSRPGLSPGEGHEASADHGRRSRLPRMSRDLGLGLVGERVLDGHEMLVGRWPDGDAPHIPIMSPISRDHVPLGGLPRTIRARRSKGDRAMAKYLTQEWLDEGTKLAQGQPE